MRMKYGREKDTANNMAMNVNFFIKQGDNQNAESNGKKSFPLFISIIL
jgi:hypothetical protein